LSLHNFPARVLPFARKFDGTSSANLVYEFSAHQILSEKM
jgi:hypothetical protein